MHAMDLAHACNRMITNRHGLRYVHVANKAKSCWIMKRQRYRYRFQDIVLFSTSSPILQRAIPC